jgi:molybdopterin/thiamine biosynthesis adenylyltransferase
MANQLDRYARQTLFAPLGKEGQHCLAEAHVLLCGCGALGSVLANTLVRAGVGHLKIVDRDFLELSNLQRQVLFDESDVASGLPKAVAAARRLEQINSEVEIEAVVTDVDPTNIAELAAGADLLLDGTDNFETRFLINDLAVRDSLPWVYGGCIGTEGQSMTVLPGKTPCFRCLMHEAPAPGTTATCDTAGILAPIVNVVASIQAIEAIKILSGQHQATNPHLTIIDMWDNEYRQVKIDAVRSDDCPCCGQREFSWLDGKHASQSAVLCGRNAVQLSHPQNRTLSLAELAGRLGSAGEVRQNEFMLRFAVDEYQVTVFADGRAIIGGTDDISTARGVYAKYIGS